ncbi:conserved hypothetical protein [Xanthomonas oryzae pv. oryzae KACC 10331]|uniref:Uncharacterized protein n=1 Tax=Xanthomonas oryzae pv. oryzae (strain KACC10331 / KXO85) TaxID=291331 RepID=Q5H5H5_XANOR|nr:conserved hypothetical protein [Xanthomonas oryzae pv. oryzae KACC 10331]
MRFNLFRRFQDASMRTVLEREFVSFDGAPLF